MTMKGPLVALALLLSCASAALELQRHKPPRPGPGGMCPNCPNQDRAPDPGNFSFYFLVRQWPYTFCTFKQCTKAPNQDYGFTLHGLWPNLDNHCPDDFPEVCDHTTYDSRSLSDDVLDDMAVMWPSYKSDDTCFHNHEWACHGTCSKLSQPQYFEEVIALHKSANIAAALKEANIEPSDNAVSTADFTQALTKAFDYAPILHCHNDHHSGHSYIDEVWQCVDKDTWQIVDCQQACTVTSSCAVHPNQKCGSSIVYDTPDTSIYPLSPCTLHCEEKSGTCRTKKGNDVLTTV